MSEIPTVRFYIEDDVLFKDEPLMGHEHVIRRASIFPKDAFIACYKKMDKGGKREKNGRSDIHKAEYIARHG